MRTLTLVTSALILSLFLGIVGLKRSFASSALSSLVSTSANSNADTSLRERKGKEDAHKGKKYLDLMIKNEGPAAFINEKDKRIIIKEHRRGKVRDYKGNAFVGLAFMPAGMANSIGLNHFETFDVLDGASNVSFESGWRFNRFVSLSFSVGNIALLENGNLLQSIDFRSLIEDGKEVARAELDAILDQYSSIMSILPNLEPALRDRIDDVIELGENGGVNILEGILDTDIDTLETSSGGVFPLMTMTWLNFSLPIVRTYPFDLNLTLKGGISPISYTLLTQVLVGTPGSGFGLEFIFAKRFALRFEIESIWANNANFGDAIVLNKPIVVSDDPFDGNIHMATTGFRFYFK